LTDEETQLVAELALQQAEMGNGIKVTQVHVHRVERVRLEINIITP